MTLSEIDQLLQEQFLCRIVIPTRSVPYFAPFQYAFVDGVLYFHFTDYGKKMALLRPDVLVCVEVEKCAPDLSTYCFVVLTGNLQVVSDSKEKDKAISKLVETAQSRKISKNFLLVHGFPSELNWDVLKCDKSLVIVKLVNVTGITGLKS